ncbi:MAG: hypothetical protein PHC85_00190 [Candidatus Pacebacteria bacterium]|nr:hypothetical protein [Candidatus Paceibacterota bacterium]
MIRFGKITNVAKGMALAGFIFTSAAPAQAFSIKDIVSPEHREPVMMALASIKAIIFTANAEENKTNEKTPEAIPEPPAPKIIETREIVVTAYSSTPDQTDDTPFETAMGTETRDGIVAANFLEFGTKVRLPEVFGDKVFVVEDRMARKNSHKVDVWMPTRQDAMCFGVKNLTMEIVEVAE